jgi:hypothetical protein
MQALELGPVAADLAGSRARSSVSPRSTQPPSLFHRHRHGCAWRGGGNVMSASGVADFDDATA